MSIGLEGYTLTFSDEFTGTYLDTNVWKTKYWWGGRTLADNGEKQYFADRSTSVVQKYPAADPFRIVPDRTEGETGDGILSITAQLSPNKRLTDGLPYVSGMINTHGAFSQTYGYFEIDAKVPAGQGLWPAFWMLPQSGNWPPEIDVLELLGHDPSSYYVGAHWSGADGAHRYDTTKVGAGLDLSQGFHTYGTLWTPDSLSFYLDDEQVGPTLDIRGLGFDEPMYLLAGLAVGGNWPGDPDATTRFPAEFQIDAIRVYAAGGTGEAATPPVVTDPSATATVKGTDSPLGDRLSGTAGNDVFWGGAGADRFTFAAGMGGRDVILDFDPTLAGEVVEISKALAGVKGFSALYRNIQDDPASGDAVLKFAGGSITFADVSKAQLGYDDFVLV
ncbi:MAG TPA: glycoside hydrolase family 16 protein [Microvirga sp.]|jgi:beta-glucanase (GH16 family)|nr:glycoside hydrolase family 16 protein [Microvirga sp.]